MEEKKRFQNKKLNTDKNKRNAKIFNVVKSLGVGLLTLGVGFIVKRPNSKS